MARPRFIPGETVVFPVRNRSGKKKLAAYLASRLGVRETWAAGLLDEGAVRLDGRPVGRDDLINLSDGCHEVEVRFPEAWPKHMAAVPMDLAIIHEDDCLLVLDKPPGIVVHPARGHLDGNTLQNGVRHRYRHLLGRPGVTIGPPHRLDQDTSGVVVFALRTDAYIELVRQFSSGEPLKSYLAVVEGEPPRDEFESREAIGVDPDNPKRGKLVAEADGGKAAATRFAVLARGWGASLLLAKPGTGRPHQIRLHAAGLGHPVVGDRDYHPEPGRHAAPRQALHAASLTISHPVLGGELTFRAGLPADMRELLGRVGIDPEAGDADDNSYRI